MDHARGRPGEYTLAGTMLEVFRPEPFWAANGGRRLAGSSLSVWLVDEGSIAGVAVDGIAVVTLTLAGLGPAGRRGRLILVDEEARPEQVRWVVDALQGRLGGPLSQAAGEAGAAELGFYQVPVNYRIQNRSTVVAVPRMLRLVASGRDIGARSQVPLFNRLWPDWSGEASEASIDIPERRIRDDLRGARAVRGPFRFQGTGD